MTSQVRHNKKIHNFLDKATKFFVQVLNIPKLKYVKFEQKNMSYRFLISSQKLALRDLVNYVNFEI